MCGYLRAVSDSLRERERGGRDEVCEVEGKWGYIYNNNNNNGEREIASGGSEGPDQKQMFESIYSTCFFGTCTFSCSTYQSYFLI